MEDQFPIDPILFERYRKSVSLETFPKVFVRWFEGASEDEKTSWFTGRFLCLKYHLYLSGFVEAVKVGDPALPKEYVPILGMDFQSDPHSQLFKCFLQKRPGENLVLSDLDQVTKKRMILWPRGLFKDLDCKTLIPTPKGFSQMEDLNVGDEVFSDTGEICRVTGTSPVFTDHVCYELEFSTGEIIVAGEEHLWVTDARTDIRHIAGTGTYDPETQKTTGRKKQCVPSIKTTKQIAETLGNSKRGWFEANHSVVVAKPIQTTERALPIPPYVLGAWLGDGTSTAANLTGIDLPIIEEIRKAGQAIRQSKTDPQKWEMTHDGLISRLRQVGVFKNKHIPVQYLRASYAQRLALLQGLMDTDGTCSKDGCSSFTGVNRRLVENCRELVASLGIKPSKIAQYESYVGRANNKSAIGQLTNTFHFTAYADTPVFRLARKRIRQPERKKVSLSRHRQIVRATIVPTRPTKCIMVDSPSHLYLTGEGFIPTHNTSAVRVEIVQMILNYPDIRICFLTGGDKLAKAQLRAIKQFFERPSKRFKWLFPEFCCKDVRNKKITDDTDPRAWSMELCKLGNAHEFTVPCRANTNFPEPTFAISTARSVKAGSHFDVIFIDDLVNEQNYRKVESLEKCYQDYIDICPLLEPSGFIVMTGTRYSYGDTYERIQDDAKKEMKEMGQTIWQFFIRDCWSHGCQNCSHTSVYHDYEQNISQPPCIMPGCLCPGFKDRGNRDVLFPQTRTITGRSIGHTLKFLEGELIRVGAEFFANQYENKPIATGAQTFEETLIGRQTLHFMTQIPTHTADNTFVVGDLAYVGQTGRDYSVLYACRLFRGQIFIFDCEFGTWDSAQVAENTVDFLLKHRPQVMYYEKFNGWEAYNNVITAHASSRGVLKVPIQWEKGSQVANAKLIRIGSVKGPLNQRRLWFFAGMKGYDQLVQQLIKWPKLGKHDDFADTCGMVVAAPTGWQMENPPVTVSVANWLRRLGAGEVAPEEDSRLAGSYDPHDPFDSWK